MAKSLAPLSKLMYLQSSTMPEDWSKSEVALIVADYFAMLQQELQGHAFNKKEHREALLPQLHGRSGGAIEFKHQNISAVLARSGQPFVRGYKPRFNYQQLLEEQVLIFLQQHAAELDPLFDAFVEQALPTIPFPDVDFETCLEDEPPSSNSVQKEISTFRTVKINYLEKEQNNRALGAEGEQFVIDYEKWRIRQAGRADLVPGIQWTAQEQGDGAGYDILSKNADGSDRFIEVKTTKLSKETPIYLTSREMAFATGHAANFYLYRVFNFNADIKLFIKQGGYEDFCQLIPMTYKGIF